MVCLKRLNHFTFFQGCLPQILGGPFLNALPKLIKTYDTTLRKIFLSFNITELTVE